MYEGNKEISEPLISVKETINSNNEPFSDITQETQLNTNKGKSNNNSNNNNVVKPDSSDSSSKKSANSKSKQSSPEKSSKDSSKKVDQIKNNEVNENLPSYEKISTPNDGNNVIEENKLEFVPLPTDIAPLNGNADPLYGEVDLQSYNNKVSNRSVNNEIQSDKLQIFNIDQDRGKTETINKGTIDA